MPQSAAANAVGGPSPSSSLVQAAERMLADKRPTEAVHLTQLLWQQSPVQYAMLHIRCLMDMKHSDAALHVLSTSAEFIAPTALHMAKMRCYFDLGDSRGCCASAEALIAAASAATAVGEGSAGPPSATTSSTASTANNSMTVTALCYLGKCAELVADAEKAVGCYRQALALDPLSTTAMDTLIDHRLVQPLELVHIIQSLPLPADAEGLRRYYLDRVGLSHPSAVAGPPTPPPQHHQPLRDDGDGEVGGAHAHPPRPGTVVTATRMVHLAAREHAKNHLRDALRFSTEARRLVPFDKDALCVHLRILVDSRATPQLFEVAHTMAKHRGRAALAVYAIGCYYYAQSNFERAGRYFSRATELDASFVEAWVAFGHCYAKLEEGEQALAVYRRALYLFPGLYPCATYVGMQYSRIHSWKLAMCFLEDAQRMGPTDALVLNEIAVLCVRNHQTTPALGFLQKALEQIDVSTCTEYLDCILFNVATVYRRRRQFDCAVQFYSAYIKCRPHAAHGHTALGFTYHLMGDLRTAIHHYHTAMSIKAETFCRDMLDRALATEFGHGVGGASWGGGASRDGGADLHRQEHRDPHAFGAFTQHRGVSLGGNEAEDFMAAAAAGPQRQRRRSDSHGTDMMGQSGGGFGPSPHASVGRSLHF